MYTARKRNAAKKRIPRDKNGGNVCNPIFITIQVELQIRLNRANTIKGREDRALRVILRFISEYYPVHTISWIFRAFFSFSLRGLSKSIIYIKVTKV
jgi:hypothetical protein